MTFQLINPTGFNHHLLWDGNGQCDWCPPVLDFRSIEIMTKIWGKKGYGLFSGQPCSVRVRVSCKVAVVSVWNLDDASPPENLPYLNAMLCLFAIRNHA